MRFPCSPRRTALAFFALAAVPFSLAAQQAAKAPNVMGDTAGFERSTLQDNLWDGVNGDGSLAGFTYSAHVVTERGDFGGLAMPPSVSYADLNGDGKPDLLVANPTGYLYFYPNSGTAAAPKFTSAELIPLYLCTTSRAREYDYKFNDESDDMRLCPRVALADWRHTGLLDMLVGNYLGEVLFVPNTGNARQPQFRWPGSLDRLRVQTHDQNRLWANLLTPVAYDWTGTGGKLDLICGEGTYSANAIHLLENVGSGDTPKFSSARGKHTYLAYGDGREQLMPCVVDFDGDGNPDLLVADRTGEVGVYLSQGKPKAGEELKRSSTITFGNTSKLPGLCSLCAADFNGDGLFDLILGLPNGHIAVSYNTGTKGAPKFGPPQDLKGEDRLKRDVQFPDGWQANTWSIYGNALAYVTVVDKSVDADSTPPEGTHCLKIGYWPTAQQTFPMSAEGIPGSARHVTLMRRGMTLNVNKRYHLSFKAKGSGTEKLHWQFQHHYTGVPSGVKIERDERGGVKRGGGQIEEEVVFGQGFSVSKDWGTVQGDFTPRYKNQELAGEKTMPMSLHMEFYAPTNAGVLYLDDFELTEAQ